MLKICFFMFYLECKNVDRRSSYGRKSKFKIFAILRPKIFKSAMWDFPKFDFCPVGLLRPLIFHMGTKFGAKMLIDAEIMAKNRNSRWRPAPYDVF